MASLRPAICLLMFFVLTTLVLESGARCPLKCYTFLCSRKLPCCLKDHHCRLLGGQLFGFCAKRKTRGRDVEEANGEQDLSDPDLF
ncbi:hypothetical protein ACOMHN_014927 [Nucella lapillus]